MSNGIMKKLHDIKQGAIWTVHSDNSYRFYFYAPSIKSIKEEGKVVGIYKDGLTISDDKFYVEDFEEKIINVPELNWSDIHKALTLHYKKLGVIK